MADSKAHPYLPEDAWTYYRTHWHRIVLSPWLISYDVGDLRQAFLAGWEAHASRVLPPEDPNYDHVLFDPDYDS